jgi:hypothetical protein
LGLSRPRIQPTAPSSVPLGRRSDRMITHVKLRPSLDSEACCDGAPKPPDVDRCQTKEYRWRICHIKGNPGSVLGDRVGPRRTGSYQVSNLGAGDRRPSDADASCSVEAELERLHELGWPRGKEKFSLRVLPASDRVSGAGAIRPRFHPSEGSLSTQ